MYPCPFVNRFSAALWRPLLVALVLGLLLPAIGTAPVEAHRRAAFPTESLGSRGINVTALQHLLRARGRQLTVSGIFDGATQQQVAALQALAGLKRDGVVNEATWERLLPVLVPGAQTEAVTALQKLLNVKRRSGLTVHGYYDRATRDAVTAFQRHMGLNASGSVNLATWRNLLWHYVRPNFASTTLCDYHSGNGRAANWATSAAVAQVEAAAALFHRRTGLKTSHGEASLEHGGNISGHATHEVGLDVDLGLIRRDGRHCRRLGLDYRDAQYDRARTRQLIRAVYDAAPGRVKLIYFNDPVLVREGLVVSYPNHSHHLHIRYCEVGHAQSRYRCPAPALDANLDLPYIAASTIGALDPSAVRMSLAARLPLHRY